MEKTPIEDTIEKIERHYKELEEEILKPLKSELIIERNKLIKIMDLVQANKELFLDGIGDEIIDVIKE